MICRIATESLLQMADMQTYSKLVSMVVVREAT